MCGVLRISAQDVWLKGVQGVTCVRCLERLPACFGMRLVDGHAVRRPERSLIVSVCVWLTVMACVLWNSSVHPFSNKQLLWKRHSFAFLGYSDRN